jgi:hypothetical protein
MYDVENIKNTIICFLKPNNDPTFDWQKLNSILHLHIIFNLTNFS